ncbi:hypothetical protein [Hymenobacter sp. 5414T-23]|uniref:hypothetical protein n=1 Tax=Hymenobacter sp. 5414T-23 TaxID=2932252 RepID=UPI001FD52360|nr:hypothetical protein [Hymenobacter sp. 5414T-23]UOQ82827.1 hypothetical protein MUN83_08720 [Hymenobacter sp. 5414T-23]
MSYTAPANAISTPAGTFFNYAVNSGDGTIPLSGDLTVNGRLYIRNTILKTNSYTVTLDQYATLDEEENDKTNSNANGYILGKVATATNLNANGTYTFSNTGLQLLLENGTSSTTYPGRTVVTRLTGETYVGGTGNTTISRFFFVSPSNSAISPALDITMTLHYAQSEINSLPEGQLSFFKSKLPPLLLFRALHSVRKAATEPA